MADGWNCPNCGKAHGPHIDTCPEPAAHDPNFWEPLFQIPSTLHDPPPMWPPYTTCGDPPGSVSPSGSVGATRVVDPLTGRDLGPSD